MDGQTECLPCWCDHNPIDWCTPYWHMLQTVFKMSVITPLFWENEWPTSRSNWTIQEKWKRRPAIDRKASKDERLMNIDIIFCIQAVNKFFIWPCSFEPQYYLHCSKHGWYMGNKYSNKQLLKSTRLKLHLNNSIKSQCNNKFEFPFYSTFSLFGS